MRGLAGKTVVVTGASRGIGAATARELTRRGATVALLGRDAEALKTLSAELGTSTDWFIADVTDPVSLAQAATDVRASFGQVDAVVANAGINRNGTVRTMTTDDFQAVLDTNLTGTFRTVQAFLPALLHSRGYVLVVSSVSSSLGLGGMTAYAASKAGLEMFAHTFRMEIAHLGITVGSLHPWFAETALLRDGETAMPSFATVRRRLAPLRRLPGPFALIGLTLTAEQCGAAAAAMVASRARKRHVPRSAGLLAFARPVLNSGIGERGQQFLFGWLMKRIDRETLAALGDRPHADR